jgi:hypothetical protein
MSTRSAAARRTHAVPRPGPRPVGPRRVSGPAGPARTAPRTAAARAAAGRSAASARTAAPPRRIAAPAPLAAAAARLHALSEGRLLDRLLRSRLCIWVTAALLLGLVAVQVSLLKLNTGISRAVQSSATLERQNAGLEAGIARMSATEKVRVGAVVQGMVTPLAGDVNYLTARSGFDARRAVETMRPPTETALGLMASGGIVAASPTAIDPALAPASTTAAPTAPAAAPAPATTAAPAPAAVAPAPAPATTAPAPAPAPAATTAPAPAAAAPSSAEPATGGVPAVAGQG